MNKISEIRKAVFEKGAVTLTTDDFNQLQAEWIMRAGIENIDSIKVTREEVDHKLSNAGLLTISEILNGTPLDSIHVAAEVNDIQSFEAWLKVNQESFFLMKARMELEKQVESELYEWVLSHSAALHAVMLNFKAATQALTTNSIGDELAPLEQKN